MDGLHYLGNQLIYAFRSLGTVDKHDFALISLKHWLKNELQISKGEKENGF